jgi:hypothetical protein
MKRLILDYYRRWCWVLLVCAFVEFTIGWSTSGSPDNNIFDSASIFQFQLVLFSGALLLSFDLQRGVARTVTALPLTTRQIGRAWWLATVLIPTIALAAVLYSGAGVCFLLHPGNAFSAERLAMICLVNLLWLGATFTIIFSTTWGYRGQWWANARNIFITILFALMIGGGFMFFRDVSIHSIKFASFLGVAGVLTVAGWILAEQFVLGRASFRLAALQSKDPRGQHRAPSGYGGIPYLIGTTFVRSLLISLAMSMFVMMPLFLILLGDLKSLKQVIESIAGMGIMIPFYLIIIFAIIPTLLQIRLLRTLPMSVTKLTAVMIGLVLLPLIAVGAIFAGISGLTSGTPAAIMIIRSYALILAPAVMCVVLVGWLGAGRDALSLMISTMILFQIVTARGQSFFTNREIPFSLISVIVGVTVALAFLLTRHSLMHSSKTYRVHANPFGTVWGAGR